MGIVLAPLRRNTNSQSADATLHLELSVTMVLCARFFAIVRLRTASGSFQIAYLAI